MNSVDFDPFAGGEILRIAPTTAPQQEIIASSQMSEEANTSFNEAVSISIRGELDMNRLARSCQALVSRHDSLQTTFSRRGDELCLQPPKNFTLQHQDLRQLSPEAQQTEIDHLWKNIGLSPMNLEEGPLFFAWLLQLADDQFEFILAAHHIICDGWSIGLLLKELSELYNHGGDVSQLPAAASFFDFAEQNTAEQVFNRDIDYWKEQFKILPPELDLPIDFQRPKARTFSAQRLDYSLNSELVNQLPKAAGQYKASVVNLVLAGYFALLYRLTHHEDIVVGLPVAGQAALNKLNLVGHMVQLLPIRLQPQGSLSFRELLAQVKTEIVNASEHPNFTFGKLVEGMQVERSRVPLIKTIFNIDQAPPTLDFGSATGTMRSVPRAAENFELFLNIVPGKGSFVIEATYSTALFNETSIKAWLSALENILQNVISHPDTPLNDLCLTQALPQVCQQANNTDFEVIHSDFISAFLKQANAHPNAEALVYEDKSLSYSELEKQALTLAQRLVDQGVKEGSMVGISCQRSEKLVISALAIHLVGAAYVPLDPEFPAARLAYILEDSGAVAVIEDDDTPEIIRSADIIHIPWQTEASNATEWTPPSPQADRLAYVIYTSGSTGKPKGVRITCGSMINFLESMVERPGCKPDDRLLAVTTLAFDISVLELFLPLIVGGTTVIASQKDLKESEKLAQLIAAQNISMMQATPATWRMLLASSWAESEHPPMKALCGGEPLPPDLLASLLPQVSELWNMFGPTETTVWSSCKHLNRADEIISVGTPIGNTQIYILDDKLQALPLSVPGEICIGGRGLAEAYHQRSDLTAERFVHHPQLGRLYRTGDVGKCLPNGELQHLGRMDDQVKLRGFRIELGEIETAIINSGEVSAAAVHLWQLSPDDIRVVACCVPNDGNELATVNIRKKIRQVLPSYMVPQYFLPVETLPLTPNGKINRKALPKPEISESTLLDGGALSNETEKRIAQIWTDIIKPRSAIGQNDNFFDLGGHSLLALEAIRRIEADMGVRFKFEDLVFHRLSALAEKALDSQANEAIDVSGPTAMPANEIRRLSNEQRRMLTLQLQEPDHCQHNLPAAWTLTGELEIKTFYAALQRVMERQTALRTLITENEGAYQVQLLHMDEIKLPEPVDFSDDDQPLEAALSDAKDIFYRPFKLIDSLLMRIKLYQLSEQQYLLAFSVHQLIFDGWSYDIFLSDLQNYYSALSTQTPSNLPQLAYEFRDYAHWSSRRKLPQTLIDFHNRAIETRGRLGAMVVEAKSGDCGRLTCSHPMAELQSLESFCETHHVRIHEVLFCALSRSLNQKLGLYDLSIGLPVTGRYNPDVINLIGSFVSTLPCHVQLQGGSFADECKNLAGQLKTFHDHQDISLAELFSATDHSDESLESVSQISFSFQDIRTRSAELAQLTIDQIVIEKAQTELPIEFWLRIEKDGFTSVFDYDSAKVTAETIAELSEYFNGIIRRLDEPQEINPRNSASESTNPTKPFWRRLFQ